MWRQADRYHVARVCFVNKMDRVGADLAMCVDMMVDRLGITPLVLHLPIGHDADFVGVVDLVTMTALMWRGETSRGEDYTAEAIPAELRREAAERRERLLEVLATVDDLVLERYLQGIDLTVDEIKAGIRRATAAVAE